MSESLLYIEPGFLLLLLIATFTLAAVVLASATFLNKIRLRNVRLSWKSGKLRGYPVFSTLFLGFSVGLFGLTFYHASSFHWIISLLYFWMGCGWFTTSYLASKRYITDNGIIKNINDPSQSVQWYQVRDYLEQENGRYQKYIFLYRENELNNETNFVRLELNVPRKHLEEFRKLIFHKLARHINCYETSSISLEQLDLDSKG